MELSLREWLIIGGVVIIALIIIDGWRRMRSNRNTLRMQIDKSLVDLPEESHNPELPNGGFRVIDDDAEPSVGQSPVSLASEVESELPEEIPEPAESVIQPGELASEVTIEADTDVVETQLSATRDMPAADDIADAHQTDFDDDNLSAPRVVTEPDSSAEEPQFTFTDMPQEAEVEFESLGEVRYSADTEAATEELTPEFEPRLAEDPVAFTTAEHELSDDQFSAALDSEQVSAAREEPAFDAQDFAERDPLFEPLGDVDDGLSDYDGLSDVRVVVEALPDEPEEAVIPEEQEPVVPVFGTAAVAEDEPVSVETTLSELQIDIASAESVTAHTSDPYQYDDFDDDLSQGAEEFISPRLTETVEEEEQDTGLDFEKPITELFGHAAPHDADPQQATMDLGEADVSYEQPFSEIAVPESRFDDELAADVSHAPLIGEHLSELPVDDCVPPRQEPAFTDIEPEPMYAEPSANIDAEPDDYLQETYEEPAEDAPSPVAAMAPEPVTQKRSMQNVPDADKVLVISVVTREEQGFNGRNLLQIVNACGMHFGEMQIFNRYEDGIDQGAIQFSMTNAMEPGVFDIDNMESLDTRGVTFFMSMEEPRDVMNAYECMLGTAEAVAKNLGGELLDENRSSMRTQTKEHYRERIRSFEMRKLKPQL